LVQRAFENQARRPVHVGILVAPVVASVMVMITSGNAVDADVDMVVYRAELRRASRLL
jgi:hypothetical protein